MSQDAQKAKVQSIKECLGGKPVTIESLAELSRGSGQCARIARGMLRLLVGEEKARELSGVDRTGNA